MSRPRRLLFLAFWYPPSRASGVHRALAISRAFVDAGWEVAVVTVDERFLEEEVGSVDLSLLAEVPDGVEIRRVPFTTRRPSAVVPIDAIGRFRANVPLLWNLLDRQLARRVDRMRGRLPVGGRLAGVDERYLRWIEPVVAEGQELHRCTPVDHVLATGNPYAAFEAARRLSADLGVSFSLDYRDPWTIDVFSGDEVLSMPTRRLEAEIIEEAAAAFHVNQALADAYAERYPRVAERQHVASNGFDRNSIPSNACAEGAISFGLIGTLNAQWPLAAMFDGWRAARPDLGDATFDFAGHLGYFGRSAAVLQRELPSESEGFRYHGPIEKRAVASFYAKTRVVVVPAPGGAFVTSGKVFEAAAIGVPVLCIQGEGGGARQVLDGHPGAVFAEPDSASVAEGFLRAAELAGSWRADNVAATRAWAAHLKRELAVSCIVKEVEALVSA